MTELLSYGNSLNPICSFNIFTMKTKVVIPSPGEFGCADIYCHKQWRRVQHITEKFWNRSHKELLDTLQQCQKSSKNKSNFQTRDIVLLKDDSHHQNHWLMACIVEIFADKHGDAQNVKLKLGNQSNNWIVVRKTNLEDCVNQGVKWDQIKYWFPSEEKLYVKMKRSLEGSQLLLRAKKGLFKFILSPNCHEGSHFRFMKSFFVLNFRKKKVVCAKTLTELFTRLRLSQFCVNNQLMSGL